MGWETLIARMGSTEVSDEIIYQLNQAVRTWNAGGDVEYLRLCVSGVLYASYMYERALDREAAQLAERD